MCAKRASMETLDTLFITGALLCILSVPLSLKLTASERGRAAVLALVLPLMVATAFFGVGMVASTGNQLCASMVSGAEARVQSRLERAGVEYTEKLRHVLMGVNSMMLAVGSPDAES